MDLLGVLHYHRHHYHHNHQQHHHRHHCIIMIKISIKQCFDLKILSDCFCFEFLFQLYTNLAFTDVTTVPTVTFSLMWMGPYTLLSHTGGLLFLSTTSNSTSTSATKGVVPRSEALTLSRYFSRYWQNYGRQVTAISLLIQDFFSFFFYCLLNFFC